MSSKFELLYNQLSEDQINQIIQGLRGEQPMNNGIEVDEQLVNNEKMASYSQVVSGNNRQDKNQDTDDTNEHNNQFPKQGYTQSHYRESENVKPIFLKDEDVFGSRKPERSEYDAIFSLFTSCSSTSMPLFIDCSSRNP
jgi:hypothetical protein